MDKQIRIKESLKKKKEISKQLHKIPYKSDLQIMESDSNPDDFMGYDSFKIDCPSCEAEHVVCYTYRGKSIKCITCKYNIRLNHENYIIKPIVSGCSTNNTFISKSQNNFGDDDFNPYY